MPTDNDVLAIVDAEIGKLQERLRSLIRHRAELLELVVYRADFRAAALAARKEKLKSDEPDLVPLDW